MDIGFFSYNTEYGIRADDLARELEDRGFVRSGWASIRIFQRAERPPSPAAAICRSLIIT